MAKTNKGRKFFATTATAALVASAIVPVASAAQVNDFNSIASYAQEAVQDLVDRGVVQGDANGNFQPRKSVSRAEAATILTGALGLETSENVYFTDVKSGAWYYDAINAAVNNGVFAGKGAGIFEPNGNLTRGEAAIILVNAFNLDGRASLAQFADEKSVKEWALKSLEIAVGNGVIKGDNGKIKANDAITKQDFAVMFSRAEAAADLVAANTVKAINATTVEVTFADAVEDVKASDFTIEGLKVTNAASKQGDSKTVVLTTEKQEGKKYTVSYKGKEVGTFDGVSAVIPEKITVETTSVQGVVGKEVTLTANINIKEKNVPVTFNVDAANNSLNTDIVKEVLTNEEGIATFTYTQYNAGHEDDVAIYATGDAAKRGFAKVYWGVAPILTLTSKEVATVNNGTAKSFTATYLDPKTGSPLVNQELKVTFKENINASVTDDSTAVATDLTTGSVLKPFESSTDQRVLTIKTNAKGEATFTVTGSNTSVTPLVYVDSDIINTAGYNRLDPRDLQAVGETTKFVGGTYTFKFNKEEQFEAVANKPFTYEVEVLKADGKPYAGGTATVALHELIDSSLATNTTAFIVNNAKVKPIAGKPGVYTIALNNEGKAKFDVQANATEVSATPVVWVDINNAANIQGNLEAEEAFKLAGSVVFRFEVIGNAELSVVSDVTGLYAVSGTGLQQPKYEIELLDQAGSIYNANDYAINRATYTITNTGNSSVDLVFNPTNFTIDNVSNQVALGSATIAAGQSVTVTGYTTGNPKVVSLGVSNSKAGTVQVTGSVATKQLIGSTWTTNTSYYAAGSATTQFVDATESTSELTGVVKGYQTADLANGYGYVLVAVDGSTAYKYVRYTSSNSFFTGTQTDFNRLNATDADGFERALSVEDRISVKNNEVRLINADSSNKPGQVIGNAGSQTPGADALADALAEEAAIDRSLYNAASLANLDAALDAAAAAATDDEKLVAAKAITDAINALVEKEEDVKDGITFTATSSEAKNAFTGFATYNIEGTVSADKAASVAKVTVSFGAMNQDATYNATTGAITYKEVAPVTDVANNKSTVVVKAFDASGNIVVSETVTVTVK